MGFAAAGGECAGHPEDDNLLAGTELRHVDLGPGIVLEQVHGGDGITYCHGSHSSDVKLATEITRG